LESDGLPWGGFKQSGFSKEGFVMVCLNIPQVKSFYINLSTLNDQRVKERVIIRDNSLNSSMNIEQVGLLLLAKNLITK
jgi:hypothetical protein